MSSLEINTYNSIKAGHLRTIALNGTLLGGKDLSKLRLGKPVLGMCHCFEA